MQEILPIEWNIEIKVRRQNAEGDNNWWNYNHFERGKRGKTLATHAVLKKENYIQYHWKECTDAFTILTWVIVVISMVLNTLSE